jgi:hypothetical protein
MRLNTPPVMIPSKSQFDSFYDKVQILNKIPQDSVLPWTVLNPAQADLDRKLKVCLRLTFS